MKPTVSSRNAMDTSQGDSCEEELDLVMETDEGSSDMDDANINDLVIAEMSSEGEIPEPSGIESQVFERVLPLYNPDLKANKPDKLHICKDCGDTFVVEASLERHTQRRSVTINYRCEVCQSSLVFYNRCNMLAHLKEHAMPGVGVLHTPRLTVTPLPRNLIDLENPVFPPITPVIPPINIPPDVHVVPIPSVMVKVHTPVAPKTHCYECGLTVNSGLRNHFDSVNLHHENQACVTCKVSLPSKCAMKAHQRVHMRSRPFVCPECACEFSKWAPFKFHLTEVCFHLAKCAKYRCPHCQRLFNNTGELGGHITDSHVKDMFKCGACLIILLSEEKLQEHKVKLHKDPQVSTSYYLQCQLCPNKLITRSCLTSHINLHCTQPGVAVCVYRCSHCGQNLQTKVELCLHRDRCTAALPPKAPDTSVDKNTSSTALPHSKTMNGEPIIKIMPKEPLFNKTLVNGTTVTKISNKLPLFKAPNGIPIIKGTAQELSVLKATINGTSLTQSNSKPSILTTTLKGKQVFSDPTYKNIKKLTRYIDLGTKPKFRNIAPLPPMEVKESHVQEPTKGGLVVLRGSSGNGKWGRVVTHCVNCRQDIAFTLKSPTCLEAPICCNTCITQGQQITNAPSNNFYTCKMCNAEMVRDFEVIQNHLHLQHNNMNIFHIPNAEGETGTKTDVTDANTKAKIKTDAKADTGRKIKTNAKASPKIQIDMDGKVNKEERSKPVKLSRDRNKRKKQSKMMPEDGQIILGSGYVLPPVKPSTGKHQCSKCAFTSKDDEEFKTHLVDHRTDDGAYQCMECGECFVVRPSLEKHLFVQHRIQDIEQYIEDEECCYEEPEEDPPARELDGNTCQVCYQEFSDEAELSKHFRSHGMAFLQQRKLKTLVNS